MIGNILLRKFDAKLNSRGIVCVRYIDDFLLLGPSPSALDKAFESAREELAQFGMIAYDPDATPEKASRGKVSEGFQFLGCYIKPGLVQPSRPARQRLLQAVDEVLDKGRKSLKRAAKIAGPMVPKQRYAQTLVEIDRILRGWGHAFAFCNGRNAFRDLDRAIDQKCLGFRRWTNKLCQDQTPEVKRRVMGVFLLSDTATVQPLLTRNLAQREHSQT